MALWAVLPTPAGRYDLFQDDLPIGVESFEREDGESGSRYEGRSRFIYEGVHYVFRSRLELGDDLVPTDYSLNVLADGRKESIGAVLAQDRFELHVDARGNRETRVYPARGAVVVLDNMVVYHYQALIDRYDALGGGARSFNALVPQKLLRVPLVMEAQGFGEGRLEDRAVEVERIKLRAGGHPVLLAVERNTRELLDVEVTDQGLRFVRAGFVPDAGPGRGP